MHSKINVPKKSKRLIIWNGGSRTCSEAQLPEVAFSVLDGR